MHTLAVAIVPKYAFPLAVGVFFGIDALIVDIEVNLQPVPKEVDSSPQFLIAGLPDAAIRESRKTRKVIDGATGLNVG